MSLAKTIRLLVGRNASCVVGRCLSSYTQEASHLLQAEQSATTAELSQYSESDVRAMLSEFKGGSVDLDLNSEPGIAKLILNYPEKMNAMTGTMMLDLADGVSEIDHWWATSEGKGVVLTGAGSEFCAGADLDLVRNIANPVAGAKMSIFMGTVMAKLFQLPLVTMALIDGRALGGGADLAIACDFRLMTPTAKIGFVQAKMGISPGWGGGTHLTRIVGKRQALRLLAEARIVGADEALTLGLSDFTLKNGPSDFAEFWRPYAKLQPKVLRTAKCVVFNAEESVYTEALNRERDLFSELWGQPLHLAILKAQQKTMEKKKNQKNGTKSQ